MVVREAVVRRLGGLHGLHDLGKLAVDIGWAARVGESGAFLHTSQDLTVTTAYECTTYLSRRFRQWNTSAISAAVLVVLWAELVVHRRPVAPL